MVEKIENRLQFLITISIFFPFVLYSFFKEVDETEKSASGMLLKASTLVAAYLVSYLVFLVADKYISEKWIRYLNILVLLGIASFIFPIWFTSWLGTTTTGYQTLLVTSALGLQTGMPIVILISEITFGFFGSKIK